MIFRSTIVATAMLAAHPAAAEDHRFEADPVATVHENFVACVLVEPHFDNTFWCVHLRGAIVSRKDAHMSDTT